VKNIIYLDPKKTTSPSNAGSVYVYELLRAKIRKDQLDVDAMARKGTINKAQYVESQERLAYGLVKQHHEIASAAVTARHWPASMDVFGVVLTTPTNMGGWMTFEGYFATQKTTGHSADLEKRFDRLSKD
jgi:hypothetical protein